MSLFFTRHPELYYVRRLSKMQYYVVVHKASCSMQHYVVVQEASRVMLHFVVVPKASPL
jgi:hypothetical protein